MVALQAGPGGIHLLDDMKHLLHFAPHIGLAAFAVGAVLYVRWCRYKDRKLDLYKWD